MSQHVSQILLDPFTRIPLRYPERHPLAGQLLGPLGYRRNGAPIWPTLGGAPGDDQEPDGAGDGDDQDDDSGADGDQDDKDDDQEPDGADQLGDKGKKALDSIKESRAKARADRDAARKERDDARAELDRLKAGKGGGSKDGKDDQPDAEEIRRQARESAEKDARTRSDQRIVKAELKAAAAGKLEDPADAIAFINAGDFEVDDDGQVDEDELTAAIDDLLERKPHLAKRDAAGGGRRPKPDKSQGSRGPADLDARIAAAQKKGDGREVIRLQNEKLRRPAKAAATR